MTRLSAFAFCALALTAASTISAFPFAKRDDGSGGASVTSPTPTSTPLALCLIENGLIHVDNITSGITCVGRSDVSGDALTNGSSTVVFGLPTNSSNVTVSLYSDDQCQVLVAVIPCQELPPTTCFINYTGVIVVETVYSDVRCIGRADLNTSFVFNNGTNNSTTNNATLEFTELALTNSIQLRLFSDDNCTVTIQTEPFIVCNFTFPPTPTATPSPCSVPAGPVCIIQDDKIYARQLPLDIQCVARSDDTHEAFPVNGAINFGLPPQSTSVVLTAYTNGNCTHELFTISCVEYGSTCPTAFPTNTYPYYSNY